MTLGIWLRGSIVAFAVLIGAEAGTAQVAPPTRLQPPTATLPEEFSAIVAVRELSDGRALVGDRIELRLVVADFTTGAVRQIGRRGRGPGEYPGIRYVLRLGGDSTLLVETSSRRWLLLDGDRIVATIPPDHPAFQAASGLVYGADTRGYLLAHAQVTVEQLDPTATRLDSTTLRLVRLSSGLAERIARLAPLETEMRVGGVATAYGRSLEFWPIQLDVSEAALLFPDGWLAVARLNPYRVDWRSPTGTWTLGGPLPFRAITVNDREKEAYAARRTNATGRPFRVSPALRWPEFVPPFEDELLHRAPLIALPDGHLLIARTPSAAQPETRYDVVDRRGRLVTQLVMPSTERIVGGGRNSVYVAAIGDDGLERLRRHPWP